MSLPGSLPGLFVLNYLWPFAGRLPVFTMYHRRNGERLMRFRGTLAISTRSPAREQQNERIKPVQSPKKRCAISAISAISPLPTSGWLFPSCTRSAMVSGRRPVRWCFPSCQNCQSRERTERTLLTRGFLLSAGALAGRRNAADRRTLLLMSHYRLLHRGHHAERR
jgi:hypothetical protein